MKYKDWEVVDKIPTGWVIDKTCGSPMACSVFITNNKSPLKGQKRKILKQHNMQEIKEPIKEKLPKIIEKKIDIEVKPYPARTVNDLARKKFEHHLLKEIIFDLMVCDLENWDKKEYIKELKKIINSFNFNKNITSNQQDLFGVTK